MNLFWNKLFGRLHSTEKFEKLLEQSEFDAVRYLKIERSEELQEYNNLLKIVDSSDFKNKKSFLTKRKYKDSSEYKIQRKFLKLQNNARINLYFETLKSDALRDFLVFKDSSMYKLLQEKEELAKNLDLQRFFAFEKSKEYKNYLRFHDSDIIREYKRLQAKVEVEEFKEQLSFWADKGRWYTTPESQIEKRFQELESNDDIQFFLKQKKKDISNYRKQKEKKFEDDFSWKTLKQSAWSYGYRYKNEKLIENHSLANEKQANNSGKNVSVLNSQLRIATKREDLVSRAWDAKQGFIEKEFQYSSDLIQTFDSFRQKEGVFMAKIRCQGNVNHAFVLEAEKKLPLIKLFHYNGKRLLLGTFDEKGANEVRLKGLDPSKFYIYSVRWTEKEIIWSINNLVVHWTKKHIPREQLHLSISSFISEQQAGCEALLELDWVRVYSN